MAEETAKKFDNYQYQQQYIKENIKFLHVPFNKKMPDEIEMFEYLDEHAKETGEKKGAYVKRLIRQDMSKAVSPAAMQELADEIDFPEQDGYEDREAIRNALEQKHSIFVTIRGNFKVEIDVDEKKVLSVKDYRRMLIGI